MKRFILALTASAIALVLVNPVNASTSKPGYVKVQPITKSLKIGGQISQLVISPEFRMNGSEGKVGFDFEVVIDASDLKRQIESDLNRRWKHSECGKRLNTHHPKLSLGEHGNMVAELSATGQIWTCIKLPKITCKSKMVSVWGMKTKIPHSCRTESVIVTKTRVSQSLKLQASIKPIVNKKSIGAVVSVDTAMPSGLLGKVVKGFGFHGKIKSLIAKQINKKLGTKAFSVPKGLDAYQVNLADLKFIKTSDGKFGLNVKFNATVTQQQLAVLLSEKIVSKQS